MKSLLRLERTEKKLSQLELSKILKVSRQTIHSIETEKYIPSTVLALKIAKFFDLRVEQIFILEQSDYI